MGNSVHLGQNIKRIREIQGIKQEALALELGTEWNQKKISLLESKETIDDELLTLIASALKVTAETIKTYTEHTALNHINNHSISVYTNCNPQCTFNPLDKIVELYDALLKSEREKIAILERMLDRQNKLPFNNNHH
jgi:transcriptional regulator with XRE-family HTH domain